MRETAGRVRMRTGWMVRMRTGSPWGATGVIRRSYLELRLEGWAGISQMMKGEMVGGGKILLWGVGATIQQHERTPLVQHVLSEEYVDMQQSDCGEVTVTLERIQESCMCIQTWTKSCQKPRTRRGRPGSEEEGEEEYSKVKSNRPGDQLDLGSRKKKSWSPTLSGACHLCI